MKFCILFFLLLLSCSHHQKPQNLSPEVKAFEDLHSRNQPLYQACMDHKENILEQAITEIAEAPGDDDNYLFVPNESDAVYFVENFDLSKFTLKENQQEYEAIVNACMNGPQAGHGTCDTLIPAYKYFRGLISAMKYNKWSSPLVQRGVANTLSYLRYAGASESSLMDVILANDLLMRLAKKKLITQKIIPDTLRFKKEAEDQFKRLRKEVRKISQKEMSCQETKSFYQNERQRVKALSKDFLLLMNKFSL
jgi:hypothetical protein